MDLSRRFCDIHLIIFFHRKCSQYYWNMHENNSPTSSRIQRVHLGETHVNVMTTYCRILPKVYYNGSCNQYVEYTDMSSKCKASLTVSLTHNKLGFMLQPQLCLFCFIESDYDTDPCLWHHGSWLENFCWGPSALTMGLFKSLQQILEGPSIEYVTNSPILGVHWAFWQNFAKAA